MNVNNTEGSKVHYTASTCLEGLRITMKKLNTQAEISAWHLTNTEQECELLD
jgi:hypothetical protein